MPDTVAITTHELEPAMRLREAFREAGYRVELLTPSERMAEVEDAVLLILSGGLGERGARRFAKEAAERGVPAVGLAASAEEAATPARRELGLAECFVKPVAADEVLLTGRRLIERRRLREITGLVGETESIHEALERVLQFAPVGATVLITGESGTGKELIARGIHALSPRRHRPFIAANVAALSETVLESELFGHEKGSFTGAIAQRKGLFELANKGTLFLDEIGEMPLATQTKLLRVLEEREFMRVGGEAPIRVDVRVIAATNRELRALVEAGDFRRDLYYRLNVLSIRMPPLRERSEDIPLLVDAFVQEVAAAHDREPVSISPEALEILGEHDWPGNVRELRNLIESMGVLAPGQIIRPEDIPSSVRRSSRSRSLLPAPMGRGADSSIAPELEFVFRTMLELRVDVEELRDQFEEFRRAQPMLGAGRQVGRPYPELPPAYRGAGGLGEAEVAEEVEEGSPGESTASEEEGVVVYRPGMTMQDLEREAITAALRESKGNRRRAAEMLGIGERTLYRKIKDYEL